MKLSDAISRPEGPRRLAALAAWIQGLYPTDVDVPVLVGGGAVELYTGGAYSTGDLDFVGSMPPAVADKLVEAGFTRKGRHWIQDRLQVFVEFPSDRLDEGDSIATIRVGGVSVTVLGLEETVIDRLAAWQFWRSTIDARNAWLLWETRNADLDAGRLAELAERREVTAALRSLESFAAGVTGRGPDEEELEAWAGRGP